MILEIRATVADDGWGSETNTSEEEYMERLRDAYLRQAEETAVRLFGEKYDEIRVDIDFVPTSMHDSWYGAILDEDDEEVGAEELVSQWFAQKIWDDFCVSGNWP